MLISYSHRFIFFHLYKVAGTSVTRALDKYESKPPLIGKAFRRLNMTPLMPFPRWRAFPTHTDARMAKKLLPEKTFNRFFKFAFVRNPWDWQVSLYHYAMQEKRHPQYELTRTFRDFDEYLHWRVTEDRRLQKDFFTDENGNIVVDFIGKYENLDEDFGHVCKILGLDTELPHLNKSDHHDYRSYYSDRTRELIALHFEEDIQLFNYTFDNS